MPVLSGTYDVRGRLNGRGDQVDIRGNPDHLMKTIDPIVCLELHTIQKIINDETWLEGERRGHAVDPLDPVVVAAVCAIIIRIGAELRASVEARQVNRECCSGEDNAMAA